MELVFSEGKKHVRGDLLFWIRFRETDSLDDGPRLGISVSKRLGSAVRRNRIKRLIRESFRLNRDRLRRGTDLIVYPRPGCRWQVLKDAEHALLSALQKAGIAT